MRRLSGLLIFSVAVVATSLVGCESSKATAIAVVGDTSHGIGVSGKVQIELKPKNLDCFPGDNFNFSVKVTNSLNNDLTFKPTSSNTAIMTVVVSAPDSMRAHCVAPGQAVLTVNANADPTAQQSALGTVHQLAHVDTTLTATTPLTLNLCVGGTSAQAAGSVGWTTNFANLPVTVTSSNTNFLTVTSTGAVTAVGVGSGTVTVALVSNPSIKVQWTVNVAQCSSGNPGGPSGNTLTASLPARLDMQWGPNCSTPGVQLSPAVLFNGVQVSDATLSWAWSTASVVTGANGLAVPQGVGQGTITVTVTRSGLTTTATIPVTVSACSGITSIKLIPSDSVVIHRGATCSNFQDYGYQWTVYAGTIPASNQGVTFSISPAGIANIDAHTGHVTFANPVQFGTAVVTARSDGNTSVTTTSNVKVDNQACPNTTGISIGINPPGGSITVGQTLALKATVLGTTDKKVNWSISGTALATLVPTSDSTANVMATSAGTLSVCASANADASKSACVTVTVSPAPAPAVASVSCPTSVALGNTGTCTATVSNTTDQSVTWTSSNTAVFNIDSQSGKITPVWHGGPAQACATSRVNTASKMCAPVTVP